MQRDIGSDPSYLFLEGKLKVYENRLFSRSRFVRLCENSSAEAFLNDLSDTEYGKLRNEKRFPMIAYGPVLGAYAYLKKQLPEEDILDAFMVMGELRGPVRFFSGTPAPGERIEGVFSMNWNMESVMPPVMKKIVYNLRKKGYRPEDNDGGLIAENEGMTYYYENVVKNCKTASVREYWQDNIDMKNILMNLSRPVKERVYSEGGFISPYFLRDVELSERIPEKILSHLYMKGIQSSDPIEKIEQKFRAYNGRKIKEMRRASFSIAPVVAYILALKEEARNLIAIHTGLSAGMAREEILPALNLDYV